MPWPSGPSELWPGKFSPKSRPRKIKSSPFRLGFLEHLEELRWRLIASLAAIGIVSVAAYFFSDQILEFLIAPLHSYGDYTLYFHSPYGAFLARLKVSLLAGTFAASPVVLIELWLFSAPGLHRRERRVAAILVWASALLFLIGALLAFWVLVPFGLRFFLGFQTDSLRPLLGIGPYFSFLVGMVLACGIFFDLPVVLLGLVWAGILKTESLQKARKWVIVLFFVTAAVVTPTTDPVTQTLLALPLWVLYEICVLLGRWLEGRRKKNEDSLRRR